MKIIDLPGVPVGERLEGNLLVCEVEQRNAGTQPFVVLTLGNSSGRIRSAPFWSEDLPRLAGVARGSVVQVLGDVTTYRDHRQLKVNSLSPVPDDRVDWHQMLPSVGDTGPCWQSLDCWRDRVTAPNLRATLALFFDDSAFRARFEQCPASVAGHHAALGGLLRHTWEVATIARAIGRTVPADPDLVFAGVLLHDIGKTEAYTWNRGFGSSVRGHLYGHVVLGAILLDQRWRGARVPPCSGEELDILQHLILSHHGKRDFGAPVEPMTLEAEVLHQADDASAKADSMAGALGAAENFRDDDLVSSRSIWQLDRRKIFRGKSAWGL